MTQQVRGASIDPYYARGEFYAHSSGALDAKYKVEQLGLLLERNDIGDVGRIADVGCGAGETTTRLRDMFAQRNPAVIVEGYDIHPHLPPSTSGVTFTGADFTTLDIVEPFDLAILFDVIETCP